MNDEKQLLEALNGLSTRVNSLAYKLGYDKDKCEEPYKDLLINRLISKVLVIEETVAFIQNEIYKIEK